MIIYYALILNGHYYVRWSRPLRVLFPFALQTGQNVRNILVIIFFNNYFSQIDSSYCSKYSSNITKYRQCNVFICTYRY